MQFLQSVINFVDWVVSTFNHFRDLAIQSILRSSLLKPILTEFSANSVTHLRAFLTFGIMVFLTDNVLFREHNADFPYPLRAYLLGTVCLIGFLDLVDGSWARLRRKLGFQDGKDGEHLDPFWDKVFTMSFFLYYALLLRKTELILLCVLAAGDIMATVVRFRARAKGITIPANSFGKTKMGFQTAAIIYLVAFFPRTGDVFLILLSIGLTFGAISVIMHLITLRYRIAVEKAVNEPAYKQIFDKEP